MRFSILVRWHLFLESAPWLLIKTQGHFSSPHTLLPVTKYCLLYLLFFQYDLWWPYFWQYNHANMLSIIVEIFYEAHHTVKSTMWISFYWQQFNHSSSKEHDVLYVKITHILLGFSIVTASIKLPWHWSAPQRILMYQTSFIFDTGMLDLMQVIFFHKKNEIVN